jgi:cytochrome c
MKSTAAASLAVLLLATTDALADDQLAKRSGCLACHTLDRKIVGPGYRDVAKRYQGVRGAEAKVVDSITNGGSGKWGEISMPPKGSNPNLSPAEIKALADWILEGAN